MDAAKRPASDELERYERLAEDLVAAYPAGDPAAMRRIRDHFRNEIPWEEVRNEVQRVE